MGKQPQYSSDKWIPMVASPHPEPDSAPERKEVLTYAIMWTSVKDIINDENKNPRTARSRGHKMPRTDKATETESRWGGGWGREWGRH